MATVLANTMTLSTLFAAIGLFVSDKTYDAAFTRSQSGGFGCTTNTIGDCRLLRENLSQPHTCRLQDKEHHNPRHYH
jgi:hypothetical protein